MLNLTAVVLPAAAALMFVVQFNRRLDRLARGVDRLARIGGQR